MERLQKVIANSGICSRRKAEELILAGKVIVNGERISELGVKVDEQAEIIVDGKMIEKEDAILDFNNDVEILVNKTKAFCENPVCFFFLGEDRIKVFDAKIFNKTCDFEIGTIIKDKKHFLVQAKNGVFEILTCQAPGGKKLSAQNFLNGYRFKSMVVGR